MILGGVTEKAEPFRTSGGRAASTNRKNDGSG